MINNKLKVGIVGFGAVGQKRRLYIDRNPYLITTAVCDVRFKKDGSMVDGSDFNYKYDLLENQSYENKISGNTKEGIKYFNLIFI